MTNDGARRAMRSASLEPPGPPAPAPRAPNPPLANPGRRRGRPPAGQSLTQGDLIDATLELIRREGVAAVTMRRVAEEVGVVASALYVHVRNRDELLALCMDRVNALVPMPTDRGDWRAEITDYAVELRAALLRYSDIAVLGFRPAVVAGDDEISPLLDLFTRMRRSGVDAASAVWGLERVLLYTTADAYDTWFAHTSRSTSSAPNAPDTDPVRAEFVAAFATISPEERFRRGVDAILTAAGGRSPA